MPTKTEARRKNCMRATSAAFAPRVKARRLISAMPPGTVPKSEVDRSSPNHLVTSAPRTMGKMSHQAAAMRAAGALFLNSAPVSRVTRTPIKSPSTTCSARFAPDGTPGTFQPLTAKKPAESIAPTMAADGTWKKRSTSQPGTPIANMCMKSFNQSIQALPSSPTPEL